MMLVINPDWNRNLRWALGSGKVAAAARVYGVVCVQGRKILQAMATSDLSVLLDCFDTIFYALVHTHLFSPQSLTQTF